MENQEKKFTLKTWMNILFWGAVWGIVEATLGTILHLPGFDGTGIYFASTAIVVPIAYCLMANCYKKTESFYAVYLMGVLAAVIKLSVGFIVGFTQKVYNPAIYIVFEALAMGSFLAVFRPKNVLSLRTFGAIVAANTVYQLAFLGIRAISGNNAFASYEAWVKTGEKYLFTMNGLAIVYTLAIGSAAFGLFKLAEHYNFKFKFDLNKFITSPITAGVLVALSFSLTIGLAAI